MRRIDKVQLMIMEALKDSHVGRIGAMSALLSITLSIAKEEADNLPGNLDVMPNDPIKIINKLLAEIQEWQDYFLDLAR
ncbi:hypothetical protein AAA799D07_00387 [Marine Group I thaumarchaeote SCGC AAA799-D07]|nr:hypothetical protein AAA799D07_00387 [Marine Group I thaumarchaeote SCGC AAA799-D07]